MPARAVLFDLGDTLIFEARAPDDATLYDMMTQRVRPLLRQWNVQQIFDLPALLRELYRAVDTAEPARRERGYEVDAPFIARGALAAYGIDASPDQAHQFWAATNVGLDLWGAQAYPDAIDTLQRLRSANMPVALVSNTWFHSPVVRDQLAGIRITPHLLPVIVTSADLMRPKPRPEPFLRALDALAVAAADAVFVGDSLEADVRGAKALGMTTVWKLNGRHEVPPEPEADYTVHDLWELFTLDLLPEAPDAALSQQSLTPHEDGNAGRY